jgi:hypothetical protein
MQRCPHCHETLEDELLPICWHCGRDTQVEAAKMAPAPPVPDATIDTAPQGTTLFDLDHLAAQLGLEPEPARPPIAPPAASPPPVAPPLVDPLLVDPPPVDPPPVDPPPVVQAPLVHGLAAQVPGVPAALALLAGLHLPDWRRYQLHILGVAGLGVVLIGLSVMGRPNAAFSVTSTTAPPAPATAPATRTASTPAPANVQIEEAPGWVIPRRIGYGPDGSRMLTLQLAALRDLQVAQQHIRPVLAVRCLSRRTEVFVSLGTSAAIEAGDTNRVTVQFDQQTPIAQQWIRTDTYQELFAPDGLVLARQLADASLLRFTFTPFSSRPVVVEFNVRGFDEHVGSIAKTCGWPSTAGATARKR